MKNSAGCLSVRDDGVGLPEEPRHAEGIGMHTMALPGTPHRRVPGRAAAFPARGGGHLHLSPAQDTPRWREPTPCQR
jgi:hypothetical protein